MCLCVMHLAKPATGDRGIVEMRYWLEVKLPQERTARPGASKTTQSLRIEFETVSEENEVNRAQIRAGADLTNYITEQFTT
jgi:hypothetical protein